MMNFNLKIFFVILLFACISQNSGMPQTCRGIRESCNFHGTYSDEQAWRDSLTTTTTTTTTTTMRPGVVSNLHLRRQNRNGTSNTVHLDAACVWRNQPRFRNRSSAITSSPVEGGTRTTTPYPEECIIGRPAGVYRYWPDSNREENNDE